MPKPPQMLIMDDDGVYPLEVVGESRYHANLKAVAGQENTGAGVDVLRQAFIVREPRNANDRNALRVDIDQRIVGYIPRETAAVLAPALDANGVMAIQTVAHVTAGFAGGSYSVWLAGDLEEIMVAMANRQIERNRRRVPVWVWALLALLASGCGCVTIGNLAQR